MGKTVDGAPLRYASGIIRLTTQTLLRSFSSSLIKGGREKIKVIKEDVYRCLFCGRSLPPGSQECHHEFHK